MKREEEERILVLYTLYTLEKRYNFSFGHNNLKRFLLGNIFPTVQNQHLYIIPTYGSLRYSTQDDLDSIIQSLIDDGSLIKRSFPSKYSREVLALTKKGIQELKEKHKEIKGLLTKYFKRHYLVLAQKGDRHLGLSEANCEKEHEAKSLWHSRLKTLRSKYPRYGYPWTESEKRMVLEMYDKDIEIDKIAKILRRNTNAVESFLITQGVVQDKTSFKQDFVTTNKQDKSEYIPEKIDEKHIHLAFKKIEDDLNNLIKTKESYGLTIKIKGGNGLTAENPIEVTPSFATYESWITDWHPHMEKNLGISIIKSFFKISNLKYLSIEEETFWDQDDWITDHIISVDGKIKYYFSSDFPDYSTLPSDESEEEWEVMDSVVNLLWSNERVKDEDEEDDDKMRDSVERDSWRGDIEEARVEEGLEEELAEEERSRLEEELAREDEEKEVVEELKEEGKVEEEDF